MVRQTLCHAILELRRQKIGWYQAGIYISVVDKAEADAQPPPPPPPDVNGKTLVGLTIFTNFVLNIDCPLQSVYDLHLLGINIPLRKVFVTKSEEYIG